MKHILLPLIASLLVMQFTGCDEQAAKPVTKQATEPAVQNDQLAQPEQPVKQKLDLEVSPDMLEPFSSTTQAFDDAATQDQPAVINLHEKKQEDSVKLKGKVFVDEEQGSRLEAIEGGEIEIEIKLR